MKDTGNPVINQFLQRPIPSLIILFGGLIFAGYAFMWHVHNREIEINLDKHTQVIESMWQAVTTAHEETMKAYFMHYVMNKDTLEILKRANSKKVEEQNLARADLFRHLSEPYSYLTTNLYVRQLHFHLPNNRSFLRFHYPQQYGDDLTPFRSTVVMTNKLKRPHFSFETGSVITGFRYVFPIIDSEGNHLGSVELSRPFEVLRKTLNEIDIRSDYQLLIRQEEVMPKLFEEVKRLYTPMPFVKGWVIEDPRHELPDSTKPLKREYQGIFEILGTNKEFLKLLESSKNGSIAVSAMGGYYKVAAIKLFDFNNSYAASLIAISLAQDIEDSEINFRRNLVAYTLLMTSIAVFAFLYIRETIRTRQKTYELETITSTMGSGLYVMDDKGFITFVNDRATQILGFSKEEFLGSNAHDSFHRHTGEITDCPLYNAVNKGITYCQDDTFLRKDGRLVDVHVCSQPLILSNNSIGAVIVFTDITDRKRMERELYKMSVTDSMTGLYNRRFMMEMLINNKNQADRHNTTFSILMLDIDKFKSINDTYGHETGDDVILKTAVTLKESIRTADIASRWGGEEFLIVLTNTDLEGAKVVAEKIRSQIETLKVEPLQRITVSVGVASYIKGESLKELIKRADNALYEAKASGRNCVRISSS